jgi:HAD superfamily hydrolase (TIGR01549 family)
MGKPKFRFGALKNQVRKQSEHLLKNGCEIVALVGEGVGFGIEEHGPDIKGLDVRVIPQKKLMGAYDSYYPSSEAFYHGEYDSAVFSIYKELIDEALQGYEPDVILSWESPVPFLKQMYPEALILNLMPGFMSRVPFPELLSIDPIGFFQNGLLAKEAENLLAYEPSEKEKSFLQEVRQNYLYDFLATYSPYRREDLDPAGKFDNLILLPLQVGGYFAFDANCNFRHGFDMVLKVLNTVPANVGVVVTQYVTKNIADQVINEETRAFLEAKYDNFIYHEGFDRVDGISQYLMSAVDGVAAVSSSIGLQALLWQKPVFVFGASHLTPISEGQTTEGIAAALARPQSQKYDGFLAYILTRLQPLLLTRVYDSDWFYRFMVKAKERFDQGCCGLDLFDVIDDIEKYTTDFIKAAKFDRALQKLEEADLDEKKMRDIRQKSEVLKKVRASKYEVVSFDIFDTLLVRPFAKPTDLFRLMGNDVARLTDGAIDNFLTTRMLAEQTVRDRIKTALEKHKDNPGQDFTVSRIAFPFPVREAAPAPKQEITLQEIYTEICDMTGVEQTILDDVMFLEIAYEKRYLQVRRSGKHLYDEAVRSGKTVIITSDMYLPQSAIEDILRLNGFDGYHKLYLSSTIGLRKHEGELFEHVLKDLKISPRSILHIGDNLHGDIKMAEKYKIDALWTKRTLDCFYSLKKNKDLIFPKRNQAGLAEAAAIGLNANHLFDDPTRIYWGDTHFNGESYNLGYYGLGWMFTGFAKWIIEEAIRDGIDTLYFLSRDGEIIMRAYEILARHYPNAPKARYLYSSRRSAQVASISTRNDIFKIAKTAFYSGTLGDFLGRKFGLDLTRIDAAVLEKHGFSSLDEVIQGQAGKDRMLALVNDLEPLILATAAEERELYQKYLRFEGFGPGEKQAVVDIGYAGSMQAALMKITDVPSVGGYYLMTFREARALFNKGHICKGFCGNFVEKDRSFHPISKLGLAFEVVFSNTAGSFIKFARSVTGEPKPVFESTERENAKRALVPAMQKGLLAFVGDFARTFKANLVDIDFDSDSCLSVFVDFLYHPAGRDAELFEGVTFDDQFAGAGYRYMVPPRHHAPLTGDKLKAAVWKQGTEVFFRRPDINQQATSKNKPKIAVRLNQENKTAIAFKGRQELKTNMKPNPLLAQLIRIFCSKAKYKKYIGDPYQFHLDSKSLVVRSLGRVA